MVVDGVQNPEPPWPDTPLVSYVVPTLSTFFWFKNWTARVCPLPSKDSVTNFTTQLNPTQPMDVQLWAYLAFGKDCWRRVTRTR